jgi:o-succinylbenzoate synthase
MKVAIARSPIGANFVQAPGSAQRAWPRRDGFLISARCEGLTGHGEASALEGMSVETAIDVQDALASLGDEIEVEEPARGEPLTLPRRLPPSARFGLETALLDLISQRAGVGLASWLRPVPAAFVATQTLLDRLDGLAALELTGAGAVKVKLGRSHRMREEIALLRQLRDRHPACVIRADANGTAVAPELLHTLVEVGCVLLEDPCPLELLGGRAWPLPIALDEALYADPDGAMDAIDRGLASAVVLKPGLIGGLSRCIDLAREAERRGARVIVSHALESPVGLAAAAQLALAIGEGEIHGLGRWSGLERFSCGDAPIAVPDWVEVGRISLSSEPGLGIRP